MPPTSTFTAGSLIRFIGLVIYKENRIDQEHLAIFPETPEHHIVKKIDDATTTHAFFPEYQGVG